MRDGVGELALAGVGHAQPEMRQTVIGGQPRDQRVLRDGLVETADTRRTAIPE